MPQCKNCLGKGTITELDDDECPDCQGSGDVPINYVGRAHESISVVRFLYACDAIYAPNFAEYAAGMIDISQVICALCHTNPCSCPEFGSDAFFALMDERHRQQ